MSAPYFFGPTDADLGGDDGQVFVHSPPSPFIPPAWPLFPHLSPLPSYPMRLAELPDASNFPHDQVSQSHPRVRLVPGGGALGLLPTGSVSMEEITQHQAPPAILLAPPASLSHHRSRSFGDASANQSLFKNPDTEYPWLYSPSPAPSLSSSVDSLTPPASLNILLQPGTEVCWDMSSPTMNAHARVSQDRERPLSDAELNEPAVLPGLKEFAILVNGQVTVDIRSIPVTPIPVRRLDRRRELVPPVTLLNVLETLHRVLHGPISHIDWARFSMSTQRAVERAYRRRCRSATAVDVGEGERQAAQGIKKVDLLLDQFMFRGLVLFEGSNSQTIMRLITGT